MSNDVAANPVRLLAVDPGLDGCGLAVFQPPLDVTQPESPDAPDDNHGEDWEQPATGRSARAAFGLRLSELELVRCLVHRDVLRTSPDDPLPVRCGVLCSEIRHVCLVWGVRHAWVETPAYAGTYQRHGKNARGEGGQMVATPMRGFHAACGAIYAGLAAAGVPVTEVPASRLPKVQKRMAVNSWLAGAGLPVCTNQDVADAVFVGLNAHWGAA